MDVKWLKLLQNITLMKQLHSSAVKITDAVGKRK